MRVYIIRHATAVPRNAPGVVDDASRELTHDGIAKMRRQARGLAKTKMQVGRIWTSPLRRAHQTAEILAEALKTPKAVRTMPALAPGGDLDRVVEQLTTHAHPAGGQTPRAASDVALVGHEPSLSQLITRLLTGLGNSVVQLKKGGAACIELDDLNPPCRGQLIWLLTPRQLRDMS